MKKFAVVWKKIGQTPLEAVESFRNSEKFGLEVPLAYAGRLDPMAEGKLLVLIGDECKKLKLYTGLDKAYSFEILFGFKSDTGDVLGLAEFHQLSRAPELSLLKQAAQKFIGKQKFPYPHFSSKAVQGKPLHRWALEGRLNEIDIPTRESVMYRVCVRTIYVVQKGELQEKIFKKIASVAPVLDSRKGLGTDFRREPIRERWREIFSNPALREGYIARVHAIVSSGTYIRTLAEKIGDELGCSGLAFSITRETIGKYMRIGPFGFWIKKF